MFTKRLPLLFMTLVALQSAFGGKLKKIVKNLEREVESLKTSIGDLEERVQLCCQSDWIHHDDSSYYISNKNEVVNWFDAETFCESKGSALVMVESRDEHEYIKEQLRIRDSAGTGNFWTAGYDVLSENVWVWGHPAKKTIDETFWAPGEPNNWGGNAEDCIAYRAQLEYDWNDEGCDHPLRFICERTTE